MFCDFSRTQHFGLKIINYLKHVTGSNKKNYIIRFLFVQSILFLTACKTYFNPVNCIGNHKKNQKSAGTFKMFRSIKQLFKTKRNTFLTQRFKYLNFYWRYLFDFKMSILPYNTFFKPNTAESKIHIIFQNK